MAWRSAGSRARGGAVVRSEGWQKRYREARATNLVIREEQQTTHLVRKKSLRSTGKEKEDEFKRNSSAHG